ncbi:hypothetical protein [Hwangdonia sp.]|uniref:hypothetical protein n=1 Tax=Hwangdonia sp. TaxID=1883432 RepID=UPI003AB2226F
MNKVVILFFVVFNLFAANRVEAQMAAAKKIVWDVEINTIVNASKGDLWRLINDNQQLVKHSNGYVKSIKSIDQNPSDVKREIRFANGNRRLETIVQTDLVNKFMVIKINKASLIKGIKNAEIAIFTKSIDDENSRISWLAKIEGKKSQKKLLVKQLKAEFEAYAKGFNNLH